MTTSLSRGLVLGTLILAAGSPVSGQSQEFVWTTEAATAAQAQLAQQELVLSLFNTGRLNFREVELKNARTLEELMQEQGAWVGPITENIAAMLCDVNEGCDQNFEVVAERTLSNHVAGQRGLKQVWTIQEGQTVLIPDLHIVQTAKPKPADIGRPIDVAGIKVSSECISSDLCIDDYATVLTTATESGNYRGVSIATADPEGLGMPLELVPQLSARIEVAEEPLDIYSTISEKRNQAFDFRDTGFRGLTGALSRDIVGGLTVEAEAHGASHEVYRGYDMEPLHQKELFDAFCNSALHGKCPDLGDGPFTEFKIGIVDQSPQLPHCDFGDNITMLDRGAAQKPSGAQSENRPAMPSCDTFLEPHQVLEQHHGTHVLGLLAALQNQRGMAGLLGTIPKLSFVVVPFDRVEGTQGTAEFAFKMSNAITRAAFSDVKIFNFSFSYRPPQDGGKDLIRDVIDAWKDKVLFVVAAGKHGNNAEDGPCSAFPACYAKSLPNIISVVGLEPDPDKVLLLRRDGDEGEFGTNFGASTFGLGAPARNVVSTVGGHAFGPMTGSSQAAPQVTAAAALLMQSGMTRTPAETRERLIYSSRLSIGATEQITGGALDATAATFVRDDWVLLDSGCMLWGKARDLQRDDGTGQMDDASFDMLFVSNNAALSKSLGDMLRMHWEEDRGIFFYKNGDEFDRTVAILRYRDIHWLRMDIKKMSDACGDEFQVGLDQPVQLSHIRDFISRVK